MRSPLYEIWRQELDPFTGEERGSEHFVQDCYSMTEAREVQKYWQKDGSAVWIQDKESGRIL